MATQAISIERRQHTREGILGQLENITYTILRKYGIAGEATREVVSGGTPQRVQRCRTTSTTKSRSSQPGLRLHRPSLALAHRRRTNRALLRKEGTTMSANLANVVRNLEPNRQRHYPGTWLLHRRGHDPLEVHVAHDGSDRPHVLDKGAA
jgi:hypothetical protein